MKRIIFVILFLYSFPLFAQTAGDVPIYQTNKRTKAGKVGLTSIDSTQLPTKFDNAVQDDTATVQRSNITSINTKNSTQDDTLTAHKNNITTLDTTITKWKVINFEATIGAGDTIRVSFTPLVAVTGYRVTGLSWLNGYAGRGTLSWLLNSDSTVTIISDYETDAGKKVSGNIERINP